MLNSQHLQSTHKLDLFSSPRPAWTKLNWSFFDLTKIWENHLIYNKDKYFHPNFICRKVLGKFTCMPADLGSSCTGLVWGSLYTREGSWLPHGGNDFGFRLWRPTSKKLKSPRWPWINTVSWGNLSNDSFSRRNQKPPMVVSLFWRWSKTWFAPSIGSPTLPSFGCLHWGSLRLEEIVTLGGCDIKRMCKVNEIQVPGERIKLAFYEKSQCWR